jgi:hypothetical protein
MKNIILVSIIVFLVQTALFSQGIVPLSQLGEEDQAALELIRGEWLIEDSPYVLSYSNHFAVRVDGVKYYHYKRLHTRPLNPHIYAIVKSKKTGRSYFARGYYKKGRFYGSTSRIVFKGNDRFIVYSSKNPKQIYLRAVRVKKTGKKTT